MARTLVTLCTYNERDNLLGLIPAIRAALPDADLVVIDDSSPDGTADLVTQMGVSDPHVLLLLRAKKEGLGAATLAAFAFGRDRQYDLLINMDADFSHPPELLPQLVAAMSQADVACGSRYIPGGGVRGWGWTRHVMSRCINIYTRLLLGLRVRDCSGAFRCYRVALLDLIDWTRFRSRGYAFQEEVLYRCAAAGGRIAEVPFVFINREQGHSKINLWEAGRALKDIALVAVDRLRGCPVRRN